MIGTKPFTDKYKPCQSPDKPEKEVLLPMRKLRSEETCPRSHSYSGLEFGPRPPGSRICAFTQYQMLSHLFRAECPHHGCQARDTTILSTDLRRSHPF